MRFVCLFLVACTLGGCASVIRGGDEQVAFVSNPAGASLALSNGLACPQTPCDLKLSRKDDFTATFSKQGYRPESVRVVSHVSGGGVAAGAGNIIAGGIIGVGVDAYTGANLDHSPNPVEVILAPAGSTPRAGKPVS